MQEFTVKLCQLYTTTNNLNSVEHQKTYLHWVFKVKAFIQITL